MDVALDTNEFLSDPRMDGVRFQSLLAYLRKTSSGLIIPKVVWDEVVARYPERVSDPYRKAVASVKVLRSLVLTAKIPAIPDLNLNREIAALRRKLRRPSNHVRSKILSNFSDVTVEEVARRGVNRVPPANPNGEELRDVIIWLMIVGYARKSNREIAFISRDEHFREGDTLHPLLQRDIEDAKANLYYYGSIDDFIKAHAPSPRELSEGEAYSYVERRFVSDLFEIEARRFFPRYWGSAVAEVLQREVQFLKGALYDVGGGSQYGELEFGGNLDVMLFRSQYFQNIQNISIYDTDMPGVAINPMAIEFPGIFGAPPTQAPISAVQLVAPTRLNFAGVQTPINSAITFTPASSITFASSPTVTFTSSPTVTFAPSPSVATSEASLSGKMAVSVRIVSGKTTKIEVERFAVTQVTTADQLPKPAGSANPSA